MNEGVKRKRIFMMGLRGIPDVQGGVEKHVEALSVLLADKNYDVTVIGRRQYLDHVAPYRWRGVNVIPLFAPQSQYWETIINSVIGVFYAARHGADIIHIHAIGPALIVPLARLLGLKVVVTHHGFDYNRQKWGPFARKILRLGEYLGMKLSHARIAVSRHIVAAMQKRYHVDVSYIPNGVTVFDGEADLKVLDRFQLEPKKYILTVARIVPEKRQLDLIAAYAKLNDPHMKLVIVGGGNEYSDYHRILADRALEVPGVIMTGVLIGAELAAVFSNAALFILPSSHEGMPIALLEAIHYKIPVLASDIVANMELELDPRCYFPLGDVSALTKAIAMKLAAIDQPELLDYDQSKLQCDFSWDHVAKETSAVYEHVLSGLKKEKPLQL
jgi:glycosyltransferase involved in cell wall biosynthesis